MSPALQMMTVESFATVDELIVEIAAGRPIIIVDDEGRENEGDLVIAADFVTARNMNFMIRECGGFICLALDEAIVEKLQLPLQPRRNVIANQALFTVSIEARHGVSTGVSAKDRATTIKAAIDPASTADDICVPGHMFPLRATPGGVLARAGHTEAGVDIARLAGLKPAAAICEIMNEDGTMARLPELMVFAGRHGIKIGTIEALIAWRRDMESK